MTLGPDGTFSSEATNFSEWIGAMATGPPVTQSYMTGQWITARNGIIWFCIAGGTPGTWVPIGFGFPAPVTSGTTTQTYQDPYGSWWVAKNGVSGGAWKRATDVLHASYYRTATFTTPANAPAAFGYNALLSDAYGLYNSGTGVATFPVAGWWRLESWLGASATATGQWLNCIIQIGGVNAASTQTWASAAGFVVSNASLVRPVAANDTWTTFMNSSVALTGRANADTSRMTIDYLGSG